MPGVAKVDFIGEQEEKIFIELSNAQARDARRRARADHRRRSRAQNAVAAAGVFDTATDRIYLRPTGAFDSRRRDPRHRDPRQQPRVPAGRHRRRSTRGYVDPPQQKMRFQGREALGIGVTMVKGGDVIELGRALDARGRAHRSARCRSGVEIAPVASMPRAVQRSINQFVRSLAEAVLIVLAVSLREPRPAHRARRRGVDPAGARDHVPRACGCSTSACTRSRSAR